MTPLAEQERDKYARMWARPEYHLGSPGERAVPLFLRSVSGSRQDRLVDVGCGGGRAAVLLANAGFAVTCLDFCRAAVEPAAQHLPYVDAVLWELPAITFDYFYCCDVLEHIPPEKVEAVLDGLTRIATRGGFLQICCAEDGCGALIGETLHLTVQPPEWWLALVQARWPILENYSTFKYATFMVGEPYGRRNGSTE